MSLTAGEVRALSEGMSQLIHCTVVRGSVVSGMMKTKVVSGESDERAAYMSRSGVARLLGVSPNTVTRWAREGRLPSQLTLGGHHRFERSVIESLRAEMRQAGSSEGATGKPIARG
jgi:excisionase family DNA binding protein